MLFFWAFDRVNTRGTNKEQRQLKFRFWADLLKVLSHNGRCRRVQLLAADRRRSLNDASEHLLFGRPGVVYRG